MTIEKLIDCADSFARAAALSQVGHVAALTHITDGKVRNTLSLHFDEVEQLLWKVRDQLAAMIEASKTADA